MLLTIHDANLKKVAFIDNEKQNTLNYYDDVWTRNLETGSSTFEFTVLKKPTDKTYNYLNEKAFVSFKYNGKSYVFSVMTVEENEQTINCYCENLNLELINEYTNAYKANKAMTFVEYCNAMGLLNFTYLSVGINEISDQKRTLEWEGQDTKLARLLSLAKMFDAEIDFDTQLNADSTIKSFKVNVYHENDDTHQGVGRIRNDIQLTYGKNLKSITRKIDKTNVVNAIRPTGTKDGKTVVISGLSAWEEKNKDGVVEFYQKGEMLYAPISMQMYPSTFTHDTISDQWTRKDITVDSDNPTVIRAEGIKALKRLAYPAITYDVDGFLDVEVGDTIKIYDDEFSPVLIVQARVADQKISFTNPDGNKTTFANFKALENLLSQGIQERLDRMIEDVKPYTVKVSTNNGTAFKNGQGQSVVTPTLMKGNKVINSGWRWVVNGEIKATSPTYIVKAADINQTMVLTIAAWIDNQEVASEQITFLNASDGLKGDKGDPGRDGIAGKDGVGIKSTVITYGLSTSDSTQPSTWTASVPTLVKGQYLWTKTVWTYTDNTNETGYVKTYIAKDGNNGTDGIAGKDGVGIRTTTVVYAGSTSGTVPPTSGWSSQIPSVSSGQYLWTKTTWSYTDNTSETGFSVAKMGDTGPKGDKGADGVAGKDGKGIKATAITYQGSTNGTTAPTGTWSASVPTVAKGSFLWTRTIWTYTDNTTETGYAVAYMGTNGNDGTNGIAGKDGVGIKTTTITYARHTNGTTAPTSDWTTSVPTVSPGMFLWTRTVWTYTDNTNETGYSVARMGTDGPQGTPGPKGADGKTSYHHWAYSNNADGTDLTLTDNGQRYMGYYTDYTQADSTDKTKYRWADRWAKIEIGGKNILRNSAFANATDGTERFTVGGVTYTNKTIPNWWNLYNGGIPNPTTSYHAMYRESFNGKGPVIEFNESNGDRNWKAIAAFLQPSNLSFGNYTFSADIYATGNGTKIWFGFYYFNKSGVRNFHSGQTTIYITKVNEWHRVSGAIKLNNDIDLTKEVIFYIYAYGFTTNSILYLTKPQLEEGTVPTPYGVSQQDIQADIDSKADQDKVVYKTDISVTNEGIVHSASKTVNGQTIASMIAQRAEWVEIIAQLLKIKGDMIVDGAITGQKLNVGNLSAISANLGSVNAGKMLLQRSFGAGSSAVPAYNYPAFKTGLFVDNYGLIVNGGPVQKNTSEATASDMPVVAVTSGEVRFLRANLTDNIEEVLHTGLSDPDFGYIQFGRDSSGKNALIIEANGQVYLKGENYTDWARSTENSNVQWKVQGNLVIVDYDVTFSTGGTKRIVTVPTKYVPKALMLTAKAWHTFLDRDKNAQLNADGGLHILATDANQRYCGQIIWSY